MSSSCCPHSHWPPLRILLTNDDGYEAPGILAIHAALTDAGHDVYLIAPATQQSGASAGVTSNGVTMTAYPGKVWAVNGRPADAVRLGLGEIMQATPPDLVVAGANFGHNTGHDLNVSGTVGAALTALQLGFPAIAISVEIRLDEASAGFPSTVRSFPHAGQFLTSLIAVLPTPAPTDGIINVNVPARPQSEFKGITWVKPAAHSILTNRFTRQADGRYRAELNTHIDAILKTDAGALAAGYITLTLLDGDTSRKADRNLQRITRSLQLTGP